MLPYDPSKKFGELVSFRTALFWIQARVRTHILMKRLVELFLTEDVHKTKQGYQVLRVLQSVLGSRMFIQDPGTRLFPLRLSNLGSNKNKKEEREKISCPTFLWSQKFYRTKFIIILVLNRYRQTYPGSGSWGQKSTPDPRSWIRICKHCLQQMEEGKEVTDPDRTLSPKY